MFYTPFSPFLFKKEKQRGLKIMWTREMVKGQVILV